MSKKKKSKRELKRGLATILELAKVYRDLSNSEREQKAWEKVVLVAYTALDAPNMEIIDQLIKGK